jgi:hypothetical protein
MITEETLFIIGAGASNPYGYPTGTEILNEIIGKFTKRFAELYKLDNYEVPKNFVKELVGSRDKMIDYFLATSSINNTEIGKKAILLSIHDYEQKNQLDELKKLPDDDWFRDLTREMTKDLVTQKDVRSFKGNRVNFLTFNYDRTIEYFLGGIIQHKFSVPEQEVRKYLEGIEVVHIYGRLPFLPWENSGTNSIYGRPVNSAYLGKNFNSIKTIHERNSYEKEKINSLISKAKRIFFLGFGFADENLKVLDLMKSIKNYKNIYCTALGISEKRKEQLSKMLAPEKVISNSSTIYITPILRDCGCSELLQKYL